jgi:CheY-like chemotaxis protein
VELDNDLRIAVGELFSAHYAAKRLSLFYSPEALVRHADREALRNAISLATALHDYFSPLGQRLQALPAAAEGGVRPASPAAPRVVVADDHPAMLEMVVSLLRPGFEVVAMVADGQAALEAVQRLQPDLVVLDISMPVLGGIAAAHKLREAGSRTRVVFLTAHQDAATLAAAREAGGLGFVLKASLDTDLVLALREALAGRIFISMVERGSEGSPDLGTA